MTTRRCGRKLRACQFDPDFNGSPRKNPPSLAALPPSAQTNTIIGPGPCSKFNPTADGIAGRLSPPSLRRFKQARRAAKALSHPRHPPHRTRRLGLYLPKPCLRGDPHRSSGEDAGTADTRQPCDAAGTKHPGAPPPLLPGGHMAFLLLPDRRNPHPALLLEEAEDRLPIAAPPFSARAGPLSHHPLSLSVTIV